MFFSKGRLKAVKLLVAKAAEKLATALTVDRTDITVDRTDITVDQTEI